MWERCWKQCFPRKGSVSRRVAVGRRPDSPPPPTRYRHSCLRVGSEDIALLFLRIRPFGEGRKQVKDVREALPRGTLGPGDAKLCCPRTLWFPEG